MKHTNLSATQFPNLHAFVMKVWESDIPGDTMPISEEITEDDLNAAEVFISTVKIDALPFPQDNPQFYEDLMKNQHYSTFRKVILDIDGEVEMPVKVRTKEEWLAQVLEAMPKCRWFIIQYFGEDKYNQILQLHLLCNASKLYDILNDIWFRLPDSFNIANPKIMNSGWREFLGLLELYSEDEGDNIFGSKQS
jgi:hypothetical protein